jgi:acyl-CoA thioesterase
MFDRDTASKALGIELLDAGNGQATVRMTVTGDMVNGHAMTHGGYLFMLADTAFRVCLQQSWSGDGSRRG